MRLKIFNKKKGLARRSFSEGGFTLIELLVVISIISVLTALSLPNFVASRQRARDTQRKSDVRQLQKALELYKQDQSPVAYPLDATWVSITCASPWTVSGIIYMNKFPCDPLSALRYSYTRNPSDSTRYTLYACVENKSDTDSAVQVSCASGKMYQVTEP